MTSVQWWEFCQPSGEEFDSIERLLEREVIPARKVPLFTNKQYKTGFLVLEIKR